MAARKGNVGPEQEVGMTKKNVADEHIGVEIEETVEEVVTVKKNAQKEPPLNKEDVIELVSLIPNVSYKDNKYGDIYRWEKPGDVVEMSFEVVNYLWQNHKTYFKAMWIRPLDNRVVKKFALESIYRDYDFLMDASNYIKENVNDICDSIRKTPQTLRFSLCNKIKSLVSSGEVSDIHVLREIEKSLNIDLIPLIG